MANVDQIHFCKFFAMQNHREVALKSLKSSDDNICFENLSSTQLATNNTSDVLEDEFLDFKRFCVDFIFLTMSKRFEFVSSQLAQAQRETASHIFCVKDDGTQASF